MKKGLLFLVCLAFLVQTANALSAKSAILMEASSEQIVFEQDAYTRRGIASTTKIMTALLVLELADLDAIVTVKKSCTGIEGSSMYLQPGEELTVRDLLYGLMLQSGNDCAAVLADYVGGSEEGFVALMNEKAQELHLEDTSFSNPSGLPEEDHYSTAFDMARLTVYAMKHPEFQKIVSTKSHTAGTHYLQNHNRLLRTCEGVDGVKTGFTKSAGRCLVSSAVRNGTRLVAVTLSAPNDWQDHAELYDLGFSKVHYVSKLQQGDIATEILVVGGMRNKIPVVAESDLEAVIAPDDAEHVSVAYYLPRFLYAPIRAGDVVGSAVLLQNGQVLDSIALLASVSVNSPEPKGLRGFLARIFS